MYGDPTRLFHLEVRVQLQLNTYSSYFYDSLLLFYLKLYLLLYYSKLLYLLNFQSLLLLEL